MRRLDLSQKYSKRTYYFGGMAFIVFLITQAISRIEQFTEKTVPIVLLLSVWALYLLLLIVTSYNAIKSLREKGSKKKIIGLILAVFIVGYYIFFLASIYR